MIEHTHDKKQYAIVIGRRAYLYKRNKPKAQEYTRPMFVGIQWFRNGVEANEFKHKYDA